MRRTLVLVLVLSALGCSSKAASPKVAAPVQTTSTTATERPQELALVPADPREQKLALGVSLLLEREHLRPHRIDDEISRRAFDSYLKSLDAGKLLLLKSHVDMLAKDAAQMDDQLHAGDLRLSRAGTALRVERTRKIAAMVAELLAAPFDFSIAESLEADPDKRSFAVTEAELRDRWRQTLKNEVLGRIVRMEEAATAKPGTEAAEAAPLPKSEPPPTTFEGREKKAREDLAKTYAGRFSRLAKPEPLEAAETFLNAIASVFDPHTRYLAPAEQENFDIQISGSLEGIGAVLAEDDHYIEVRELVPGGAAWREGTLEAGDLILAVRQANAEPIDVADMHINEVVRMIRGPKGTVVSLTVKKPDERVVSIAITRDVVVVEDAYAKGAVLDLGAGHDAVGYVQLPSFYGNTRATRGQTPERDATADLRALLERFRAQKVAGVVIDLRGNGGGLLSHATGIAGLLIDRGPVVQVQNSGGKLDTLGDDVSGESFAGPVIVLVDRFSASASEILAGALQDYRRALIVGTGPTHGKGTVQTLVDLERLARVRMDGPPLGMVKLTIQQFFLVDGGSTQWRGVVPDIVLPDPAIHLKAGERYLDGALPFSSVTKLEVSPWPRTFDLKDLAQRSQTRVEKNPVFGKITARGKYLLSRRDDTLVELELEAWRRSHAEDKKALDEFDTKLDEGPERFSVDLVNYAANDPALASDAKRKNGKPKPRWEDGVARDPWLEEALFLVDDMTKGQAAKGAVR